MSHTWLTAEEAAAQLPVGVNTIRRWIDAYLTWCTDQGITPGPLSPEPPPESVGMLKGWLLPEQRGSGRVRAVDPAHLAVVRARYHLNKTAGGGTSDA